MKKGVLYTLATYFLFSVLFSLILLNFEVGKTSNLNFNHRLFAFRLAYQYDVLKDMIEDSMNQRFSLETDNNYVYLTMYSSLNDGMKPDNNLNDLDDFLTNVYEKKTAPKIKHDFTPIYSDLSANKYVRKIEPYNMSITFNYATDEIVIDNAEQISELKIELIFDGTTGNITWSVQPGDLIVGVVTPTRSSGSTVSKSSDGSVSVYTTKGNVIVQFLFGSGDDIKVKYDGVYGLNLKMTMKLDQTQKNLFKVTSPYSSVINMSMGDYSMIRGLD